MIHTSDEGDCESRKLYIAENMDTELKEREMRLKTGVRRRHGSITSFYHFLNTCSASLDVTKKLPFHIAILQTEILICLTLSSSL